MSKNYGYYDKQKAMVKIAHALMGRGWKVYGYRADESDSMTDYWSPASCDGIYEKNGFILCVNTSEYTVKHYSGKTIERYNYKNNITVDNKKIEALKNMTVEKGCTPAEEENAKARIQQILNNAQTEQNKRESSKTVDYVYPVFQVNPGRCTWHIEKDNAIYDKGTNIYKFSDLPYKFDERTGEVDNNYYRGKSELTADEKKLVNEFQSFILKLERIVNGMNTMSDGTKETETAAMEQIHNEKLEKVIIKETKKVLKMVEVTDRKNILVGDYLTFKHHCGFWLVTESGQRTGTWKGEKKTKNTFDYESVGAASRGYKQVKNAKRYYQWEDALIREIEEGKVKIYELKEVEEIQEVVKYIRAKQPKQNKQSLHKEEIKENTNTLEAEEVSNITVTMNEEKKGIEIKFAEKPAQEIINSLKENGFWWLKSKSIWCAKQTPERIEFVNGLISVKAEEVKEEIKQEKTKSPYETEFKPGYYYNVHFKEWNFSIAELKQQLTELYILAEECGDNKLFVIGADYEMVMQIKEISDKNGSILFVDAEFNQEDINTVNTITGISTQIIDKYELYKMQWTTSEQYKTELLEQLKIRQIKINKTVLEYLHYSLPELEKVLNSLLESDNSINSDEISKHEETLNSTQNSNEAKQQQDYTKLIEKIENQIESNNKKIEHLSGDYKTNTWKRLREQESRDKQKDSLKFDNRLLEYIKNRILENHLTELEKALTVKAFRDDIHSYCGRHFIERKPTSWQEIEYPRYRTEYGSDNWYNKEVPTKQKRLNKGNIYNTKDLIKAVEEYKIIIDNIELNSKPDATQEKIKKLEREYRMEQKGDIHFTENKELLNQVIELAEINSNDKVLEPSAGIGSLADAIKQYTNNIDVCEHYYSYCDLLKLKGYNVKANDFLQYAAYNIYDKVVANVPFSDEQNHVRHIYNVLKSGGRAVIITSNHWTFASDKASQNFREWLDNLTYEVYDVAPGKFNFTNVACKILVIDKNEETKETAI